MVQVLPELLTELSEVGDRKWQDIKFYLLHAHACTYVVISATPTILEQTIVLHWAALKHSPEYLALAKIN